MKSLGRVLRAWGVYEEPGPCMKSLGRVLRAWGVYEEPGPCMKSLSQTFRMCPFVHCRVVVLSSSANMKCGVQCVLYQRFHCLSWCIGKCPLYRGVLCPEVPLYSEALVIKYHTILLKHSFLNPFPPVES